MTQGPRSQRMDVQSLCTTLPLHPLSSWSPKTRYAKRTRRMKEIKSTGYRVSLPGGEFSEITHISSPGFALERHSQPVPTQWMSFITAEIPNSFWACVKMIVTHIIHISQISSSAAEYSHIRWELGNAASPFQRGNSNIACLLSLCKALPHFPPTALGRSVNRRGECH